MPATASEEVVLACEEALINAIMHAGDVEGEVSVSVLVWKGGVEVAVRDRGCGFDTRALDVTSTPNPLGIHGRGLFLIYHLMDDVKLRVDGGTEVRMVKRLSQPVPHAQGRGPQPERQA